MTGVLHIKGKKQRKSSIGCLGRLDPNCLNGSASANSEFNCNYIESDITLDDSLVLSSSSKLSDSLELKLNISDDRSRVYLNDSVYMPTVRLTAISPTKTSFSGFSRSTVETPVTMTMDSASKSIVIESPIHSPVKTNTAATSCFKIKTEKICSKINKKNLKRL